MPQFFTSHAAAWSNKGLSCCCSCWNILVLKTQPPKSPQRPHTPQPTTIPVEMEGPFTRMSQNFFLSSLKQQRGYVIATTQALSFSFFPPFSTLLVCVCSTVLLEFPNHPQEFPNLPTPMIWLCKKRLTLSNS